MEMRKIGARDVITVPRDATVLEAAKKMREHHVGDVIVVRIDPHEGGEQAVPVGIVTDRDIVLSLVAFGIPADAVEVGDIMSPVLRMASEHDSFYHILNIMKEHGVKRVPIVNESGYLEGIVSSEDIIAVLAAELGDVAKIIERQHTLENERRRKVA